MKTPLINRPSAPLVGGNWASLYSGSDGRRRSRPSRARTLPELFDDTALELTWADVDSLLLDEAEPPDKK